MNSIRFIITLEDGSQIKSHDENGNPIKDHANALLPHNTLKWVNYELISPNGTPVSVNFKTGIFRIGGVEVHPSNETEADLANNPEPQNFENVDDAWKLLNGLPYFPVVGRRLFLGDWGELNFSYCGWKKKIGNKVIKKVCFLSEYGMVIFT